MAYVYDNKTYRNLQQQVKENMDDIARLQSLKLVGLDVSYIVDTEEDLADITAEQGMVVAVGTEQPYTLFVYNDSSWVDFGEFPKAGPQGAQGPQGQVGNPGPRGLTGEPGPRGYTGAAGPAGSPGPQGARGPQGPAGPKGDRGVVDAYAADAESITAVGQAYVDENGYLQVCTSLSPLTFEQGASVKGPKGDTGEQGPQGIQGEQGAQGPTGATGPQGARGPQGEQGIRGPQGEQGIQGPQGPTGATGPEGPQGPKGDTGAQGPTGPTGPQGPKGDPGLTASVEVNGQVYTTDSTGKITLPDYPADVAWGNITGTLSSQTDLQSALNAKQDVISDLATIRSGAAAGATAVQPADLATVATSGSYNDLTNKPTIGNATLTIQKNGASVGTFTANATTSKSIDITVPTKTSDITNDSGFITSSAIPTNYVTTDTAQNITGVKTFSQPIVISSGAWPTLRFTNSSAGIVWNNGSTKINVNNVNSNNIHGDVGVSSSGDLNTSDTNLFHNVTLTNQNDETGETEYWAVLKFNGISIDDYSEDDYNDDPFDDNAPYNLAFQKKNGTIALTSDIPTNYVTTDTTQEVSGTKTFSNNINVGTIYGYSAASSVAGLKLVAKGGVPVLIGDSTDNCILAPYSDNIQNLGYISATNIPHRWKDLYLAGNITDGTNTVAVANIADKTNSETWTFTLNDGTTTNKTVVLG